MSTLQKTLRFACLSVAILVGWQVSLLAQQDTDDMPALEPFSLSEDPGSQEVAIDFPATVESSETDQFLFDGQLPSSLDQLRSMEQRFKQLTEKLMPATVNIQIFSRGVGASQGSGVVVTADGYILTAAHVIGRPGQVARVVFPDGKSFRARTLGLNDGTVDSGMLKIINDDENSFPYVNLGISGSLKLGQWVMAIGHPGGLDDERGLVTRIGRVVGSNPRVIRTDCTLVGGDSGGPLFDMNGELIGIHSRIGRTLSDNYHVPVDQYSDNWDKLSQGLILNGRPWLGFDVVKKSNVIKSVSEDSPAGKAGLEEGDIVIMIEQQSVGNKSELGAAVKSLELLPQQKVTIRIKRDDEELDFEVTLGRK